jgi:hypothetical protein
MDRNQMITSSCRVPADVPQGMCLFQEIGRGVRFPPDIAAEKAHSGTMTTTASIAPDHLIDEGKEFVATLLAASPSQLTACEGWTVHEITAHVAAGSGKSGQT